ncbi:uroporphyrinogen-III synthase, partial [Frankia sp. Cpl3]|nr:uroporphyrinogen-III synthase [Frankia sp. Cpl3]
ALHRLGSFDWVMFTSANGVAFFFKRLRELGLDIRSMRAKVAAVGPKTAAALEEKGLVVNVLPGEFRAEGLLNSLQGELHAGEKVLLPRADIARETLPRELRERGLEVTEADTYDTVIDAENVDETVELL